MYLRSFRTRRARCSVSTGTYLRVLRLLALAHERQLKIPFSAIECTSELDPKRPVTVQEQAQMTLHIACCEKRKSSCTRTFAPLETLDRSLQGLRCLDC